MGKLQMNNFTKEELEDILEWATKCLLRLGGSGNPELMDRIESMIDNYCEHKNQFTDSNYFSGCADCGKKW